MSKIIDTKFEKFPEMCCDLHENYNKSVTNGYTGTLNGAFFPPICGLSACFHLLIQLWAKISTFCCTYTKKKNPKFFIFSK